VARDLTIGATGLDRFGPFVLVEGPPGRHDLGLVLLKSPSQISVEFLTASADDSMVGRDKSEQLDSEDEG
jgi:hypothetical protein